MKKIQIYFILCLLIFGVYLLKHRTNNAQDLLKQNTSELILSIKKIPNSNTIINIQDLTKFKWTKVYAFTSSIERFCSAAIRAKSSYSYFTRVTP